MINLQSAELFDYGELEDAIEDDLVKCQKHPELDLWVYNYTPKTQFSRAWNDVTLNCRGLVLDEEMNIVGRCLRKFFNFTEVKMPNWAMGSPPVVSNKLDGSYGQVLSYEGQVFVSTRGSFASKQAIWATEWLKNTFPDFVPPENITPIVEIIYPENRVVVDYKSLQACILLGAIDNVTGADIPVWEISWWPGEKVGVFWDIKDIDTAYRYATSNAMAEDEGVVATWYRPGEPSFRLKIKNTDYLQLHKLYTQTSTRTIWEHLRMGNLAATPPDSMPDELYKWYTEVVDDLVAKFQAIADLSKLEFDKIKDIESRKEFAEKAKKTTYPGITFLRYDNRPFADKIWKLIEPEWDRPFVNGD